MVWESRERWRRRASGPPRSGGGPRRGGGGGGNFLSLGVLWPTRRRGLWTGRIWPDAYRQLSRLLAECREDGAELSLFLWRAEPGEGREWTYRLSVAVSQPRGDGSPPRGRPVRRVEEPDDEPEEEDSFAAELERDGGAPET